MIGPGNYDDECTAARLSAKAAGAVVIIVGGNRGHGFSAQFEGGVSAPAQIASVLRQVADEIERDSGIALELRE